ncbi:TIGR04282 family arsenosugar biosynthesis glycosyltransferase [Planctomonas psychrotolerans]|uniref:TIGR04282 family arsenosugar biosynthesis glycosyltransferase n=1 Tax=Planctomonas psychrotolerans TaxID=2528712 RepID=UPI001238453A|nr:DUF2064 domain-containing protein [Planctomonas psychrotolerans]
MSTLVVIAKECLPGRVKTRLHPPLTLEQAADLAAASLSSTLEAALAVPATRRILYFDGNRPPVGSEEFDVIPQTTGGLDERIAAIFDLCEGPTMLIGMDTPQVTAAHLAPFFADVDVDDVGSAAPAAWFGPASDGGFWALGLSHPSGDLVRGVPMSRDDTGAMQRARLESAGLAVRDLPMLTDVDTIATAREVARTIPGSRFAALLAAFAPPGAEDARDGAARNGNGRHGDGGTA